jgi:hypothetical protein
MSELEYKMVSSTQASYLACLLDTEGTIALYLTGEKKKHLQPAICIVNTKRELLDWTKTTIGFGGVRPRHLSKDEWSDRRKQQWIYGVYNINDIIIFLEFVQPFLVIKGTHAELLLIFCKEHILRNSVTDVEMEIYYALKELNRRGK